MRDELVALLEDVLRPADPVQAAPPAAEPAGGGSILAATPLFKGFSGDELTAVIQALHLRAFDPGEIVITEGEPLAG